MARILYGVAGEGMGHGVRSRVVIEHLKKNHEVAIAAAGKAYPYLSSFFDVHEIDYFKIVYRNNKTSNVLTALNNIARFPFIASKGWKLKKFVREFKPDLIITDFEPLVCYVGLMSRIPVLSIDNQHVITKAD